MSATRTQVYLTEEQRRRIDEIRQREGISLAAVVRRALDEFFARPAPAEDVEAALRETFGAVPDAEAPRREDWNRRWSRVSRGRSDG